MSSSGTISFFALLLVAACARSTGAPPPPPAVNDAPPASAREALEVLRGAATFDDAKIGYSADLSPLVAAFRVVLADPDAAAGFHELLEKGTPAGRLYGAAGLYFADPPAFDAAVVTLASLGGNVTRHQGCGRDDEPIASVVRSRAAKRIVIEKGQSLTSWFANHPDGHDGDLAGGYTPLSFLAEDDQPAPRGPAR